MDAALPFVDEHLPRAQGGGAVGCHRNRGDVVWEAGPDGNDHPRAQSGVLSSLGTTQVTDHRGGRLTWRNSGPRLRGHG